MKNPAMPFIAFATCVSMLAMGNVLADQTSNPPPPPEAKLLLEKGPEGVLSVNLKPGSSAPTFSGVDVMKSVGDGVSMSAGVDGLQPHANATAGYVGVSVDKANTTYHGQIATAPGNNSAMAGVTFRFK